MTDPIPANASDRPLRIAMIAACPFPAPRGTPVRIERMADALVARGHRVDVITYHLGASVEGRAFAVHRLPDDPRYRHGAPGPSWRKLLRLDPMLAASIARRCASRSFDILHAHHVEGLLTALPASRNSRIPLVYDVHTLLETELPYYRLGVPRGWLRRVGRVIDRQLPRLADHVVAVSAPIAERLARSGVRGDRLDLIANGVEPAFFALEPVVRQGRPRLVYAGNLAAYQGVELLLRAFALARARHRDLVLELLTGDCLQPYVGLARELGIGDALSVRAVALSQLPGELACATVAANPRSDGAGVPQKLCNYMAAACPIVSAAGSARHLVDGENALVVADGDAVAFAGAIGRLIDDHGLARRLGDAARRLAAAEFDWARVAAEVEAVHRRVIARAT